MRRNGSYGCRILGIPETNRKFRLRYTTLFCRVRFAAALLPPFMALAQTPGKVSFQKDVAPLLAEKCWGCHGGSMKMNDLALDTRQARTRAGARETRRKPSLSKNRGTRSP